ncbi:MAG: hypothetical protein U1G07_07100 [Verrucomicrobiota bacterium]
MSIPGNLNLAQMGGLLASPLSSGLQSPAGFRMPGVIGALSALPSMVQVLAQLRGGNGVPGTTPAPSFIEPTSDSTLTRFPHLLRDALTTTGLDLNATFRNRNPSIDDVIQGNQPNCPVAATLMALAFCHPAQVKMMLIQIPATRIPSINPLTKGPHTSLGGFAVVFAGTGGTVEIQVISSSLYVTGVTQYSTTPPEIIYLRSSVSDHLGAGPLWPCLIEKGYALKRGGYGQLNYPSPGEVMFDFAGRYDLLDLEKPASPGGSTLFEKLARNGNSNSSKPLNAAQTDAQLQAMFSRSNQRPTIACTPEPVVDGRFFAHHCYAGVGFQSGSILLRNPLVRSDNQPGTKPRYTVTMPDFKKNFTEVLQALV